MTAGAWTWTQKALQKKVESGALWWWGQSQALPNTPTPRKGQEGLDNKPLIFLLFLLMAWKVRPQWRRGSPGCSLSPG